MSERVMDGRPAHAPAGKWGFPAPPLETPLRPTLPRKNGQNRGAVTRQSKGGSLIHKGNLGALAPRVWPRSDRGLAAFCRNLLVTHYPPWLV